MLLGVELGVEFDDPANFQYNKPLRSIKKTADQS
jgi:hypothetical protein